MRAGALYARGAIDDKGNLLCRLAALDAVRALHGGAYPCNIKFVIEGEEETGSTGLEPFVAAHKQRLAADACIWEFGGVDHLGNPNLFLGLRGICYVVSCGYGLRNLEDWRTGLREMHRVLRSGGRLLVLDFGKPDNRVWRAVYFAYLRFVVPVFGKLFCGDSAAYAYILKSLHAFPAQHGVDAALRESGCESVGLKPLLGGVMAINYGEKGK